MKLSHMDICHMTCTGERMPNGGLVRQFRKICSVRFPDESAALLGELYELYLKRKSNRGELVALPRWDSGSEQ